MKFLCNFWDLGSIGIGRRSVFVWRQFKGILVWFFFDLAKNMTIKQLLLLNAISFMLLRAFENDFFQNFHQVILLNFLFFLDFLKLLVIVPLRFSLSFIIKEFLKLIDFHVHILKSFSICAFPSLFRSL